MYCSKCGKEIKDDSIFCYSCGAKVEIKEKQAIHEKEMTDENFNEPIIRADLFDEKFEEQTSRTELAKYPAQIKRNNVSKWKETAIGVAGCLLYLVFAIGGIALLVLLFRGMGWITENVYPWTIVISQIALFIIMPISLILSIFRKTRGLGSVGILISSYTWGLSLWVWSLIIAYSLAGTFWLIFGILLGGIGIVPIALIAALIASKWFIALQITLSAIVIFAVRGFSIFLAARAE